MQALEKYAQADTVIWCQEEHANQGAWRQIRHHIEACLKKEQHLSYVGRAEAASTAAGYKKLHEEELAKLLAEAFNS